MSDTPELKPCPFCGGSASIFEDDVGCFNGECPVEPHAWAETKDEAIAAWNDRYSGPADWIAEHKLFEAMLNGQAFVIREAALREVLALCKNYPYVEGVENAILELIGEKK